MTTTTERKFRVGDYVRVHPTPVDGIDVGEIVATLDSGGYTVNLGNVHSDDYQVDCGEGELSLVERDGALADGEDGVQARHIRRPRVKDPWDVAPSEFDLGFAGGAIDDLLACQTWTERGQILDRLTSQADDASPEIKAALRQVVEERMAELARVRQILDTAGVAPQLPF